MFLCEQPSFIKLNEGKDMWLFLSMNVAIKAYIHIPKNLMFLVDIFNSQQDQYLTA